MANKLLYAAQNGVVTKVIQLPNNQWSVTVQYADGSVQNFAPLDKVHVFPCENVFFNKLIGTQYDVENCQLCEVGLQMPSAEFAVANSPLSSNGSFDVTWKTQADKKVFAAPSGGGVPVFRQLSFNDLTDIPSFANNYPTSLNFDSGTGDLTLGRFGLSSLVTNIGGIFGVTADNGLSMAASVVKLGQDVGQVGNPATLLNSREIPISTYNFNFKGADLTLTSSTQSTGVMVKYNATSGATLSVGNANHFSNATIAASKRVAVSGTNINSVTASGGYGAIYADNRFEVAASTSFTVRNPAANVTGLDLISGDVTYPSTSSGNVAAVWGAVDIGGFRVLSGSPTAAVALSTSRHWATSVNAIQFSLESAGAFTITGKAAGLLIGSRVYNMSASTMEEYADLVLGASQLVSTNMVYATKTGVHILPIKTVSVTNAYSIYQEGADDKNYFGGNIIANKLATVGTAPVTTGTTKMVISDSNGLLSFADIPSGGGSISLTTTGTSGASTLVGTTLNIPIYATPPAGANTQVQYNNSGAFGASSNFTYNGNYVQAQTTSLSSNGMIASHWRNISTWTTSPSFVSGAHVGATSSFYHATVNAAMTVDIGTIMSAQLIVNRIQGSGTITVNSSSSGVRAWSGNAVAMQFDTGTGSINHVAAFQAFAPLPVGGTSATDMFNITNYYGFLIAATDEYANMGAKITNKFGVFQSGANDNNIFMAPLSIGHTNTPTAFVHIAAGTSARAQLRLLASSTPSAPNDGDIWFDGGNLRIRIAGVTRIINVT